MSTSKRLLIGAIGGLTPYILTLLVIDFESSMHDFNFYDGIGLLFRCLALVFAGALVAYFNKAETE